MLNKSTKMMRGSREARMLSAKICKIERKKDGLLAGICFAYACS